MGLPDFWRYHDHRDDCTSGHPRADWKFARLTQPSGNEKWLVLGMFEEPHPPSGKVALRRLIRLFARWLESLRSGSCGQGERSVCAATIGPPLLTARGVEEAPRSLRGPGLQGTLSDHLSDWLGLCKHA